MRHAAFAVLLALLGGILGCPDTSDGPHAALPPELPDDPAADGKPLLDLRPIEPAAGSAQTAAEAGPIVGLADTTSRPPGEIGFRPGHGNDGPVARAPQAPTGPDENVRFYTVQRGDTLWAIARRELNSGRRWKEIRDLNGPLDPHNLQIGQMLKLPAQ